MPVEVCLFDRQEPLKVYPADLPGGGLAEMVAHHAIITCLPKVQPASMSLFGLRLGTCYLSPNHPLSSTDNVKLYLCVRFKLASPELLLKVDEEAFGYFCKQTSTDFLSGQIFTGHKPVEFVPIKGQTLLNKLSKVIIVDDKSEESDFRHKERVTLLSNAVKLSGLLMIIEVKEKNLEPKEVFNNFEAFLPKRKLWSGPGERLLGLKKLRQAAEDVVISRLKDPKLTIQKAKIEFLESVEEYFPRYFDELYDAVWLKKNGFINNGTDEQDCVNVRLVVCGPSRCSGSNCTESEPRIAAVDTTEDTDYARRGKLRVSVLETVCMLEEICFITVIGHVTPNESNDSMGPIKISISRISGIPIFLMFSNKSVMVSFVTALNGYYRLSEKWIYDLCEACAHPSLIFLTSNFIHGPVTQSFASAKYSSIDSKGDKRPKFLLRMSNTNSKHIILDYWNPCGLIEVPRKTKMLTIALMENNKFRLLTDLPGTSPSLHEDFDDFGSLMRMLKAESGLDLSSCIHPSEFDKCPELTLCRSEAKKRLDFLGNRSYSMTHSPVVIPAFALSKFENKNINKGKFAQVWKGIWMKQPTIKDVVAIKQLLPEFRLSKLPEFMENANRAISWDDSSLVKVFGIVLASEECPMAVVMEYFPLGPLDAFLRANKSKINAANMLEIGASLAKALWYLQDRNIVHSNIRCRNVFVAKHGTSMTVKLSDTGVPDYRKPEELHYLAPELLVHRDYKRCTTAGDVWAYGTTMWQVFHYGEHLPTCYEEGNILHFYREGHRLEISLSATLKAQIHPEVLRDCWKEIPAERKTPRELMRHMNLHFQSIFCSMDYHIYTQLDPAPESRNDVTMKMLSQTSEPKPDTSKSATYKPFMSGRSIPLVPPKLPPKNFTEETQDDCYSAGSGAFNFQEFGNFPGATSNQIQKTLSEQKKKFAPSKWNPDFGRNSNMDSAGSQQPLLQSSVDNNSLASFECFSGRTESTYCPTQCSLESMYDCGSIYSIYGLENNCQLEVNFTTYLGTGNFGIVYLGLITKSSSTNNSHRGEPAEHIKVAVKMVKNSRYQESTERQPRVEPGKQPTDEENKDLMRELDLMKGLHHENIVKIKAVLPESKMIIMEYIERGSLDEYLRNNRDEIRFPNQLFIYASNIADGMNYLATKKIVHRDLACRNILVVDEEYVKIGDFGLARVVSEDTNQYVMRSLSTIPFKWFALESLKKYCFTSQSDVWSFGVVIWEMFSFGKTPFLTGIDKSQVDSDGESSLWQKQLALGERCPIPEGCPVKVYTDIMLRCWLEDPEERPTFRKLMEYIKSAELAVT